MTGGPDVTRTRAGHRWAGGRAVGLSLAVAVGAVLLGGCGVTPRPATALPIPAGRYAEAFDAAREAVRDLRFEVERVDARLGVITSRPHPTDGLATPWDLDQSSARQEVEDLVHEQRRRVRIAFVAPGAPGQADPAAPLQEAPEPRDLVDQRTGLTMRVVVTLSRTERPGWRVSPGSVRSSTFAVDPARGPAAEDAEYETTVGEDPALAARIVERVRAAMSLPRPPRPNAPSRPAAPKARPGSKDPTPTPPPSAT